MRPFASHASRYLDLARAPRPQRVRLPPVLVVLLGLCIAPSPARAQRAPGLPLQPAASGPQRAAWQAVRQVQRRQAETRRLQQRALRLQVPRPGDDPIPIAQALALSTLSSQGTVQLDGSAGTITATTELTLRSESANFQTLYLYTGPFKTVTSTVSDVQGALSVFEVQQGVLQVDLRQALTKGQTIVLTVALSGKPECDSGFHEIVVCRIASDRSFDVGRAWQALPYDADAQQLVYPQSAALDIVVPSGATAVASGTDDGVVENTDGTRTFSFRNDIKGSFSFAVASDYLVDSTPFPEGKQARGFFFSGAAKAQGSAWRQRVADIMAFHGARYGAYGPTTINIAEIPDGTGAAFGPMMTIFMPSQTLTVDANQWYYTTTLAHELGHQWFAGHIDVDEAISPWLSEGFASFAELEYSSEQASKAYGFDYRPSYRRGLAMEYFYSVPPAKDLPISSEQILQASSDVYFTVTYSKGALLVSLLRYLLGGDTAFFSAMKQYRKDHEKKGATVASLLASLSQASGKSLANFAQNWVFRAGYPTFSVVLARSRAGDKYRAELTVTADRDFGIPLEIELSWDDGTKERRSLPHSGKPIYTLALEDARELLSVRLDPDAHVPARQKGALQGDIHYNGAVDGIDLIYAAMVEGQSFDPRYGALQSFADWADLYPDAKIDDKDIDLVANAFGQQTTVGGQ